MASLPPPWSIILPMMLFMALPALVLAAIVMAAIERLGGAKQAPAGAALGLMAGALLGLCLRDTAQLFLDGTSELAFVVLPNSLNLVPGTSTWNRLIWAVLAALCAGRVAQTMDTNAGDGWLLRGGIALAIAWSMIPDDSRESHLWLAPAFAAFVWVEWEILSRLAALPGSSSVAVGLILSLFAAGVILIHAHSAKLMDAAIVLAFAFAGTWLVAYWRGVEIGGAVPAVAVVLPSLMLMAPLQIETTIPWYGFALPACAPLLLAVTLPITHWPKWRLHALRLVIVLIPLAIALYLANETSPLDLATPPDEEW